jgi:hypothetical protein
MATAKIPTDPDTTRHSIELTHPSLGDSVRPPVMDKAPLADD